MSTSKSQKQKSRANTLRTDEIHDNQYIGISRKLFHFRLYGFETEQTPTREDVFNALRGMVATSATVVSYGSKNNKDSNEIEVYHRFGIKVAPKLVISRILSIRPECKFEFYQTKKEDYAISSVSRADDNLLYFGITQNQLS